MDAAASAALSDRPSVSERIRSSITRTQLFAAIFVIGWANRFLPMCWGSVLWRGWAHAFLNCFDISLILWAACFCGIRLLLTDDQEPASPADFGITALILAYLLLPWPGALTVVVLTALSVYVILTSRRGSNMRRGATILLAVTVPNFWSKLLFMLVGKPILLIDASAVALVTGSARMGNVIGFTNGTGYFQVGPGCSSLTNMSLAFLAWVTVSETVRDRDMNRYDFAWAVFACIAVVTINIGRLSLLSVYPQHYQQIHGEPGATIVATLSLACVVGILIFGFRREIFART